MPYLYLIPVTLGDCEISKVLPPYNREIILSLRYFIVEDVKSARRFIKQTDCSIDIDKLTFFTLNKHTSKEELSVFLDPIKDGNSIGLLSEAGCPAIADPGAEIVEIAQRKDIRVVPLVGPSSILMILMSSGFNGQNFAFNGYLPIDHNDRIAVLKKIERLIYSESQTQIFIETPYRNNKLLDSIFNTCKPTTKLCIASNITLENEFVKTKILAEWKKLPPDLSKQPSIFALYK